MESGELPPAVAKAAIPEPIVSFTPGRRTLPTVHHRQWGNLVLDLIDRQTTSRLFLLWLVMVLLCGVLYWVACLAHHSGWFKNYGLLENGVPIKPDFAGLLSAIYFSFSTATSVGYGDVLPRGIARPIAMIEAVSALLIFGAVVAKFVSRRQDELMREIHRVTFEERLDRVQTNLHMVLSELQALAAMCDEGAPPLLRLSARLESAAMVFSGELRAVHDLLYRPQLEPIEPVLAAILASLAASLRALVEVLSCLPGGFRRSGTLDSTLATLAALADDICSECVPRVYAPSLRSWMDRVQALSREIV